MGCVAIKADRRKHGSHMKLGTTDIQRHFPMKVMKIEDFLNLGRMIKYEDAKANNLLVEWAAGMLVVFVSHCWLQRFLPDSPDDIKYRTLCNVLKRSCGRTSVISRNGESVELPALAGGFVWLDYHSVPQEDPAQQMLAIKSIVTYVGASSFFIVLAPAAQHWTGADHDVGLWSSRGWCRLERLALMLSSNPKKPLIIESSSNIYSVEGSEWTHEPVGLGKFTVDADKTAISDVVMTLLRRADRLAVAQGQMQRFRHISSMSVRLLEGLQGHHEMLLRNQSESTDAWLQRMCYKGATDNEESGLSPLRYAVKGGQLDKARELIARGASVEAPLAESNFSDDEVAGNTMLMEAAKLRWDGPELIRLLVDHRADLMARNSCGCTAICCTPWSHDINTCKTLIEMEPDFLSIKDDSGHTFFEFALIYVQDIQLLKYVQQLQESRVGFNSVHVSGQGFGAVALACLNPYFNCDVLQTVINFDYDVNVQSHVEHISKNHQQALATWKQSVDAMDKATSGMDLFPVRSGVTALMIAACWGNLRRVHILLDAKASLDLFNAAGWTALTYACKRGHTSIVQSLLEAGAATGLTDARGWTAYDWASKNNHTDIMHAMRAHEAASVQLQWI